MLNWLLAHKKKYDTGNWKMCGHLCLNQKKYGNNSRSLWIKCEKNGNERIRKWSKGHKQMNERRFILCRKENRLPFSHLIFIQIISFYEIFNINWMYVNCRPKHKHKHPRKHTRFCIWHSHIQVQIIWHTHTYQNLNADHLSAVWIAWIEREKKMHRVFFCVCFDHFCSFCYGIYYINWS